MGFHEPGEISAASTCVGSQQPGEISAASSCGAKRAGRNRRGFRLRAISRTLVAGRNKRGFSSRAISRTLVAGGNKRGFRLAGRNKRGFPGEISAAFAWSVWLRPRHTVSYNNGTFPYPLLYPFYPQNQKHARHPQKHPKNNHHRRLPPFSKCLAPLA